MALFEKYQWNNPQLRKKYKLYGWLMVAAILGIGAGMLMQASGVVVLLFFTATTVLWVMSVRVQNKDKGLGKEKKGG